MEPVLAIVVLIVATVLLGATFGWEARDRKAAREIQDSRAELVSGFRQELEQRLDRQREGRETAYKQRDAMLAEQSRDYYVMKKETDEIALFLREHYADEIKQGYHAVRGLGAIVTGYLARERSQANARRIAANSIGRSASAADLNTEIYNEARNAAGAGVNDPRLAWDGPSTEAPR